MLCFTLTESLSDNVYMHSHCLQINIILLIFRVAQGYTKINLPCFSHLSSWCRTLAFYMHFKIWVCYSTIWHFQRSQPLLVHLISWMSVFLCWTLFFFFLRGRCQRFESCWFHSAPPINSQGAPCDVFSLAFLFWSHSVNVWPCSLLSRLQNYTPSRSVKRWAATQQGLSDKATTGETLLSYVSHFQDKNRYITLPFCKETKENHYNHDNLCPHSIFYFSYFHRFILWQSVSIVYLLLLKYSGILNKGEPSSSSSQSDQSFNWTQSKFQVSFIKWNREIKNILLIIIIHF